MRFDKGYIFRREENMKEMMFPSDHFITTMVGKQHVCTWLNQDDIMVLFYDKVENGIN